MHNWDVKLKHLKEKLTFPVVIVIIGILAILFYTFSFLFPFTDNAFVTANITPVAADVDGYITQIYVQNGEYVKKGHKLITVFPTPYQLAYQRSAATLEEARAKLKTFESTLDKSKHTLAASQALYQRAAYDYQRYAQAYQDHSVSEIDRVNFQKDKSARFEEMNAAKQQVKIDTQNIVVQENRIKALIAQTAEDKVFLNETTVYAATDGIVQNMYLSLNTPVRVRDPLFSFIDMRALYIQANFNETDLRHVRLGDKALIFPRMYLGGKVFHGVVISNYWATGRQNTQSRTQLQFVANENKWLLLPQRFPVQIRVTDVNTDYPLNIGASAYVYIET